MYVVWLNLQGFNLDSKLRRYFMDEIFKIRLDCTNQHLPTILRYPDKMVVDIVVCVSCFIHQYIHGPLTKYRFRFSFKCSRYGIHPAP